MPKFKEYKDKNGEWRWNIVAGNNRIIACSAEGYKNYGDLQKAIALVREAEESFDGDEEFEVEGSGAIPVFQSEIIAGKKI